MTPDAPTTPAVDLTAQAPAAAPVQPPTEVTAGSVVVGVDGSEDSDRAVRWASDQAGLERRPLVLLHSQDPLVGMGYAGAGMMVSGSAELYLGLEKAADAVLASAEDLVSGLGIEVSVVRARGHVDPRQALIEASEHAHVVVVGSRGRGHLLSVVLGSVGASVVARAPGTVVVVRPPADADPDVAHDDAAPSGAPDGVLVGVRLDPASTPVLEWAFVMASQRGLPLTVAHCYLDTESDHPHRASSWRPDLDDLRLQVAELVAGLGEKYPDVEVTVDLSTGGPRDFLARSTQSHALVVIGRSSAAGRLARAVGTWSTLSIVENAGGTVVVVPEGAPAV